MNETHVPPMKPLSADYWQGKDWSPGVPFHKVDEITGKPAGSTYPPKPAPIADM